MAVLERIRNRAGLLVGVIFVALAAFILGDFLNSGRSFFGSGNEIGEINGKTISAKEFGDKFSAVEARYLENSGSRSVDDNTKDQINQQIWNDLLDQHLFNIEYKRAGVAVSDEEVSDMTQGDNISPQMEQIPIFKDSITQQFNKQLVVNFIRKQLTDEADPDGKMRKSWLELEDGIAKARIKAKYNNLIKKGMYVTSLQLKRDAREKNTNATFSLISKKFDTIADSTITLTDEEMKKYYEEHNYEYEQKEETRKIEYVVFQITPSQADREDLSKTMEKIKVDFSTTSNDTAFVQANSEEGFRDELLTRAKVNPAIEAEVFSAPLNTVVGPFIDNNTLKLAKVRGFSAASDSVKARHILFSTRDGKYTMDAAKAKADSVKAVVKKGSDFAALAKAMSDDPGSGANGGDLGWFTEGQMVKNFNDACFNGKVGDITIVETEYGVHIINIQEKTKPTNKVKLAYISKKIAPSLATGDEVYNKAAEFAGTANSEKAFRDEAKAKNYFIVPFESLKPGDKRINDINDAREITNWAFNEKTDLGSVSKPFNMTDRYVVVLYSGMKNKGIPTFDQLKTTIEPLAKRDKKIEMISKQFSDAFASGKSLAAVATKLNITVEDSLNATYASYSIPNHGYEPKVLGALFGIKTNKISKPIGGNTGVYMVQVVKTTDNTPAGQDAKALKTQLTQTFSNRVEGQVYNALIKKGMVNDLRYRYF